MLKLPNLNHRPGDIGLLAEHFVNEYSRQFMRRIHLSDEAKDAMEQLAWEGNIRQLRNFCERLAALGSGEVNAEFVRENYRKSYVFEELDFAEVQENERPELTPELVGALMEKYQGNKTKVAKELQISRTTLWKYLKDTENVR